MTKITFGMKENYSMSVAHCGYYGYMFHKMVKDVICKRQPMIGFSDFLDSFLLRYNSANTFITSEHVIHLFFLKPLI